jgi:very-short-patch-repair endonuclease
MNKIEKEITSNIENFKRIVNESNGTGDICKKYKFADNGKTRNLIKDFINRYSLSTVHFGLKNHTRKYISIEKTCPLCKSIFQTLKGHPKEKKTCSSKCANKFFARSLNIDQKQKISLGIEKLKKKTAEINIKKLCNYCNLIFVSNKKNQKYCTNKCSANSRKNNIEYREKLRQSQLKRVAEGTHNGWNSRNIISYPEQFFMGVLINNNISYQHNKSVGKYFIDFAIVEKKIALEIDGKQHQYENRKKSDEIKDKFLTENGWKVYRISWKSINNELGKLYIKDEINKFLEVYNGHMM